MSDLILEKSALFEAVQIGSIKLNNRMVMAPMTRGRAGKERLPNEMMAEYYSQRADVGLIVTEATSISEQAIGWNESPGIFTDEQEESWKLVTKAVHDKGGKIFLQLWHCGRASHSSFHPELGLSVAPSAIAIGEPYIHTPLGKQPHEVPRALEIQEITLIINDFKKAAERALRAGFDGVEIHGANGYLIDQFLQTKSNKRADEYGGTIENRSRFLFEVLEAVISVIGADKTGLRISPNGIYGDMGSEDFRELFLYVTQNLNKYNLAYLHIMDGLGFGFHGLGEPMLLSEFKTIFKNPIIANIGYTKESAEQVLLKGDADLVAFGRSFISNSDLVKRFKENLPLNPEAEMSAWYSSGREGYLDFPLANRN